MKQFRKSIEIAILLFLCMLLCACGQPKISDSATGDELLDLGYACAYPEEGQNQDLEAAFLYMEAAAERGCGEAADWLGNQYRWGELIDTDDQLAFQWFSRGVELGNIYSMNSLADMLENCESVEKDPDRASELYRTAAELGCPYAYGSAGRMYAEGIGIDQDYVKAVELYEKAMAEDPEDIWTMNDYARLFMDGNGVEQDLDRAAAMAKQAMNGGNVWASYLIPEITCRGYSFDVETVRKAAEGLTEIHDPDCLGWLGDMYCYGDGPEINPENALAAYEYILMNPEMKQDYEYWDNLLYNCRYLYGNLPYSENSVRGTTLCECAINGEDPTAVQETDETYLFAMNEIANYIFNGFNDFVQDPDKAAAVFEKAGSLGNYRAYYNLGILNEDGAFSGADPDRALEYYEKAAVLGDTEALKTAGSMHILGVRCEPDFDAAVLLVEKSDNCTEADALNTIGTWYYNGEVLQKDLKKAAELFSQAAESGSTPAMKNMMIICLNGEGVEKDEAKAFNYATRALDAGSTDGVFYTTLGKLYYTGKGTERDCRKAAEFFEKGLKEDPTFSNFMLGDLYTYGSDDVKDEAKALQYYKEALSLDLYNFAEFDSQGALYCAIGYAYANKESDIYDKEKSLAFLDKAYALYINQAEAGDGQAIYRIAVILYHKNQDVTKEQIEWLERGAEADNTDCMEYLAGYYLQTNPKRAAELYQRAYDLGSTYPYLKHQLGYLYLLMLNDPEKGIPLLEAAESYSEIGYAYENGYGGLKKDLDKALEYFLKEGEEDIWSSEHAGNIYFSKGDYEKAAECYERCVGQPEIYMDDPDKVYSNLEICYEKLGK